MDEGLRKLVVEVGEALGGVEREAVAQACPGPGVLSKERLERSVGAELEHDAELVRALVPHSPPESHEVRVVERRHDDHLGLEL